MLIEFHVGNFRSFKDLVNLNMTAAKLRARNKELDENNIFSINSTELLKSVAIYGANSSGKSNLIRAISFMRQFVLQSAKESQATDPIEVDSFKLHTDTEHQPSYFEIIFFLNGKQYRYGFEADTQKIHSEWLYHVPQKRESNLFIRENDEFSLSSVFREGRRVVEENLTRSNALFLSVVAQFNGPTSKSILEWFKNHLNVISGLADEEYRHFTLESMEKGRLKDDIISLIKRMDLGIADIKVAKTDISEAELPKELKQHLKDLSQKRGEEAPTLVTVDTFHKKYGTGNIPAPVVPFDLDDKESEGTQKLFYLSGPLLNTLRFGEVLIVDELDARLHPLITHAIIELFHSKKTNPNNAQLIFATHDTNLLSHKFFRRDQIWFTEKDRYGATNLYSLAEFKVRNDAPFEKDYIAGRYGAIPFIGGLHYLNFPVEEEDSDAETKQTESQ
jgi:uncharacterized protein